MGLGLAGQHRTCSSAVVLLVASSWSSAGRPNRSCRCGSWQRVLNSANSAACSSRLLMIGLSTYVPLFAQSVLGTSALVAGFALAAMTLGWPIAASLAGRIYLRLGFRTTMLFGAMIVARGGAAADGRLRQLGTASCGGLLRDRPRSRLLRVARRSWPPSRRWLGGAVW